jgi:hypothetical protein
MDASHDIAFLLQPQDHTLTARLNVVSTSQVR